MKFFLCLLVITSFFSCQPEKPKEANESKNDLDLHIESNKSAIDSVVYGLNRFINPRNFKYGETPPHAPLEKYSYLYLEETDSQYESYKKYEDLYHQYIIGDSKLDEAVNMLFELDTLSKFLINRIENKNQKLLLESEYSDFHNKYTKKVSGFLAKKKVQDSLIKEFSTSLLQIKLLTAFKYANKNLDLLLLADSLKADEVLFTRKKLEELRNEFKR